MGEERCALGLRWVLILSNVAGRDDGVVAKIVHKGAVPLVDDDDRGKAPGAETTGLCEVDAIGR
jgi:hypothetical protein